MGARQVTVRELRARGSKAVIGDVPRGREILIHVDCDALDPGFAPGANAPSPGGLRFDEVTDLIASAMRGRRLAGIFNVEFDPASDVNDVTAMTVGRIVCHVLGHLARQADRDSTHASTTVADEGS
jgi:agmatinase